MVRTVCAELVRSLIGSFHVATAVAMKNEGEAARTAWRPRVLHGPCNPMLALPAGAALSGVAGMYQKQQRSGSSGASKRAAFVKQLLDTQLWQSYELVLLRVRRVMWRRATTFRCGCAPALRSAHRLWAETLLVLSS